MSTAAKLAAVLQLDREGLLRNFTAGICALVSWHDIYVHFYTWPLFSGDEGYPVPSPTADLSAHNYFYRVARAKESWGATPYANNRRDLLLHLIEQFPKPTASQIEEQYQNLLEQHRL